MNAARCLIGIGLVLLAPWLTISACTVLPKGIADLDVGIKERGIGSWYGANFDGRVTASGEIYDMDTLTGAHRTLVMGTVVKVTNARNGAQVRVRINDRGPFVGGRIIDLSYAAARALHMVKDGITPVQVEVVAPQLAQFHSGIDRVIPGESPKPVNRGTVQARREHVPPGAARRERGHGGMMYVSAPLSFADVPLPSGDWRREALLHWSGLHDSGGSSRASFPSCNRTRGILWRVRRTDHALPLRIPLCDPMFLEVARICEAYAFLLHDRKHGRLSASFRLRTVLAVPQS